MIRVFSRVTCHPLVAAIFGSHIGSGAAGNAWKRTVSKGKYSVELFKEGGEGAGQEEIIDRHDNLTEARAIYRGRVAQYSGRPVMLRDCLR